MTCIVGIRGSEKVWIGGERVRSRGKSVRLYKQPKVWGEESSDGTRWIFGHAGSAPIQQILEYISKLPDEPIPKGKELLPFLVRRWVPLVRDSLSERHEIGKNKEDGTDMMPASFLVGIRNQLFIMDGGFAIHEPERDFVTMGEGEQAAHGALSALEKKAPHLPHEERIEMALEAASEICSGVGSVPFDIEHT